VTVGDLAWHVQITGTGPDLLLLHGTGSATHSWAALLPLLATRFRVIAPDLPGHGFTPAPRRGLLTLPGMAAALADLLADLSSSPGVVVGHSAGAALLLRMVVDRRLRPDLLIGLNPALVPPPLAYRLLLAPLVNRLAVSNLIASQTATLGARRGLVESLLRSTGSMLSPAQYAWYQLFFRSERHVHDVFTMMATWSLDGLAADLPLATCPVVLVTGRSDHWIPLPALQRLASRLPHASLLEIEGGHLLHEEHPAAVATLILDLAARTGLP
jgi:magnesium chelatase accessory protein